MKMFLILCATVAAILAVSPAKCQEDKNRSFQYQIRKIITPKPTKNSPPIYSAVEIGNSNEKITVRFPPRQIQIPAVWISEDESAAAIAGKPLQIFNAGSLIKDIKAKKPHANIRMLAQNLDGEREIEIRPLSFLGSDYIALHLPEEITKYWEPILVFVDFRKKRIVSKINYEKICRFDISGSMGRCDLDIKTFNILELALEVRAKGSQKSPQSTH